MDSVKPDRKECVLRALAATEIADTCSEPRIRQRFFSLAEHWLDLAEQGRGLAGEQLGRR